MTKRITLMLTTAMLSALIVSTAFAAGLFEYTTINDTSGYFLNSGTKYTTYSTGYGGSAKYYYQNTGGRSASYGRWYCDGTFQNNYKWHWWIGIPYNLGYTDAVVQYYARNTDSSENFWITLNQENWGDYFAYIGWTRGTGGTYGNTCYTYMSNSCVQGESCSYYGQVWWDANKFFVHTDTVPPQGHHSY